MVKSEEILSTHIIKPSSPTPIISKTVQLSFLDQIGPPLYIPIIFFYEHNNPNPNFDHDKISQSLKQSLSKTLTHFYPLAGTLHENSFVDCDDSGVEFIDARVHSPLSGFVKNPKNEKLRKLIPVDSSAHNPAILLKVKLSFFDCGGFSVGVCCSHKIGDYASYVDFMNAWAAETLGGGEEETLISPPLFDLSVRFPPNPSAVEHFSEEKEKFITKRLVFDSKTLEKIRGVSVCDEVKNPSRVEALTCFIWSIFIEATKAKRGPEKSSFAAFHAIDLRPRSVPPIPGRTFGNCYVGQFAFTSNGEISNLVSSLRGAIRSVDGDYIENVVCGDDYLTLIDEANASFKDGTTDAFNFSSWWRFPVYDVDFGWGKPSWVCTVAQSHKGLVLFMSTPQQDGIEAWINMPPDFSHHFDTKYNELKHS